MLPSLQVFRKNIGRARALGGLFTALGTQTTQALDLTDLLRSEIVLAVGVFDHFVHEIARAGVVESFMGGRPTTDALTRLPITFGTVQQLLLAPGTASALEQEVRLLHSYQSFQRPDRVADAVRLITDKRLWVEVAKLLKLRPERVKVRLAAIVDRRNQIVHEADLDPTDPTYTTKWPITVSDANDSVDFLERVGEAVHAVCQ